MKELPRIGTAGERRFVVEEAHAVRLGPEGETSSPSRIRCFVTLRVTRDREVLIEPTVPLSIGRCVFMSLPCRAVHDIGLFPDIAAAFRFDYSREAPIGWTADEGRSVLAGRLGADQGLVTVRTLDLDRDNPGVESVYDLQWTEGVSYRDVFHQNEVEQSTYNFEQSDAKMLFRHFDDYEGEAKKLIGANLALPAYEMVMKCSHTFNLLDARGAISVTERAAYIARVRALARAVAQAYYDSRERLGFPMLAPLDNAA